MTLTQTAILTKRLLIACAGFFLLGLISWISFLVYQANQPKLADTPPKPTYAFGVLPQPLLPKSPFSANDLQFNLDTATGDLPTELPNIAKVYVIPQLGATLLAADRAKELAKSLKFTQPPEILTPTDYRFQDPNSNTLNININTLNFELTLNQPIDTESSDRIIEDQAKMANIFRSFLNSKGLLKENLTQGKVLVEYNHPSLQEANEATITIWPNQIDNFDIVTPYSNQGLITATVNKSADIEKKFLKIKYIYWEIDEASSATYSLIPVDLAFANLKQNRATIITKPLNSSTISITAIKLAYFQPEEYPTYLQPIYVFEGKDFTAYVPAITSDYLQSN